MWQGMIFYLVRSEKVMFGLRPDGVRELVVQRLWAGVPGRRGHKCKDLQCTCSGGSSVSMLEGKEHGKEEVMSQRSQGADVQGLQGHCENFRGNVKGDGKLLGAFEHGNNWVKFTF